MPKPFFVLAPMDDVTDSSFRRVIAECAPPDLYFTEFVNVDGLQSAGRVKLLPKLYFANDERTLVAQLWGKQPENYYQTARQIADGSMVHELIAHFESESSKGPKATQRTSGVASFARKHGNTVRSFAGVDLNFGCPDKAICKNGCCAALINDRTLALEIIAATKEGLAGKLPLSVKTRLGYNDYDFTWHELLLNQGLAMLTVHGRTKKQMSKVPADWQAIAHIRELRDGLSPQTVLVGNGDVGSRQQGIELATQSGVDGIMIGRGVFNDPFVFADKSPWPNYAIEQRKALFLKHVELFFETWQSNERKMVTLNKFCKTYINGFDGAASMREAFMNAKTKDELVTLLQQSSPALVL